MTGIARDNDTAGGDLVPSQGTVFANNNAVIINGDAIVYHGRSPHNAATISASTVNVFANNKPVVQQGDSASCGHTATGSGNVNVNVASSAAFIGAVIAPEFEFAAGSEATVASTTTSYLSNPSSFSNPTAAENGVKQYYAPVAAEVSTGTIAPSEAAGTEIVPFLTSILTEAKDSLWRETGQGGKPSNKNITGIWVELGFPSRSPWNTDQTAWCMGFLNWVLKKTGYRWAQEAGSRALSAKPERWNATSVPISQAQPGDLVLWNFGHVNFVYAKSGDKLSFCGGNQTPTSGKNNNPDDGDVTVSWGGPTGATPLWTESRGGITGIWRPSKT